MRMQQNPVTHFLPLNETQLMMCAVITHTYVKHDNYLPNTTCEVNYITAYLGVFRKMCHQKMVGYLRRSTGAIPWIPKFGSVSSQYVIVLRTWESKELRFLNFVSCTYALDLYTLGQRFLSSTVNMEVLLSHTLSIVYALAYFEPNKFNIKGILCNFLMWTLQYLFLNLKKKKKCMKT